MLPARLNPTEEFPVDLGDRSCHLQGLAVLPDGADPVAYQCWCFFL
jgi:hypothetical protein